MFSQHGIVLVGKQGLWIGIAGFPPYAEQSLMYTHLGVSFVRVPLLGVVCKRKPQGTPTMWVLKQVTWTLNYGIKLELLIIPVIFGAIAHV